MLYKARRYFELRRIGLPTSGGEGGRRRCWWSDPKLIFSRAKMSSSGWRKKRKRAERTYSITAKANSQPSEPTQPQRLSQLTSGCGMGILKQTRSNVEDESGGALSDLSSQSQVGNATANVFIAKELQRNCRKCWFGCL